MKLESATLYYREGTSDKVYKCWIEEVKGGYVVNYANGRRGSTLHPGTRTKEAVKLDVAKKLWTKIVRGKEGDGYTPGEDGTPYIATKSEDRATGIYCQLLNPVDEAEAVRLLSDPAWGAQEKYNGKRMILRKGILLKGDVAPVMAINKKGLECGFPEIFSTDAGTVGGAFTIDGEAIGEKYRVFDILEYNGASFTSMGYVRRHEILTEFFGASTSRAKGVSIFKSFTLAPLARTTVEKQRLMKELKAARKEGIVFKRLDAPYTASRPASNGDQRKFKFVKTATCLVSNYVAGKRSMMLSLYDGTDLVDVGRCTIPPNKPIPPAWAAVEIRYLYAHKGGSLYQPFFIGVRDDVDKAECQLSQLVYKAEEED